MNFSKDFLIKLVLNCVLLIGILAGFWHLGATLFYYAVEITFFAGLAEMYFDPKKKKADISKGITIGLAGAALAFTFTFYTSALLGELSSTSTAQPPTLLSHGLDMVILTWPAIISGIFLHYIDLKKKTQKEMLNTVFPNLVNSVLTVGFLFLIAFILFMYVTEQSFLIAGILVVFKIGVDFYITTKRSAEKEKKDKKTTK